MQEEKRMTEDEMVGWHHRLNGHEFEHAQGVDNGQGSLAFWARDPVEVAGPLGTPLGLAQRKTTI